VADAERRERVDDRVLDGRRRADRPDSPIPFAPSEFTGVGVSISTTSNDGSSAADGNP
jgi:hypothetical protein